MIYVILQTVENARINGDFGPTTKSIKFSTKMDEGTRESANEYWRERVTKKVIAGPYNDNEKMEAEIAAKVAQTRLKVRWCYPEVGATTDMCQGLKEQARSVLVSKHYYSNSSGLITSYAGEATIHWADRTWKVTGFGPRGTPEYVSSDGGIRCASDRGEVIYF